MISSESQKWFRKVYCDLNTNKKHLQIFFSAFGHMGCNFLWTLRIFSNRRNCRHCCQAIDLLKARVGLTTHLMLCIHLSFSSGQCKGKSSPTLRAILRQLLWKLNGNLSPPTYYCDVDFSTPYPNQFFAFASSFRIRLLPNITLYHMTDYVKA